MTARSAEMHRLQEFVRLHRLKTGCREVCRLLGMGRITEWRYREVLAKAGLLEGDPADLPTEAVLRSATTVAATKVIAQQEIYSGPSRAGSVATPASAPLSAAIWNGPIRQPESDPPRRGLLRHGGTGGGKA